MRRHPLALLPIVLASLAACGPDEAGHIAPLAGRHSPTSPTSPTNPTRTTSPASAASPTSPRPQVAPSASTDLPAPRPTGWPLQCNGVSIASRVAARGDVTGDGVADTVQVAWCDAGAGSPPQRLGVLDGRSGQLIAVLPTRGFELYADTAVVGGEVRATGLGFSRVGVPRCCPDRRVTLSWRFPAAG